MAIGLLVIAFSTPAISLMVTGFGATLLFFAVSIETSTARLRVKLKFFDEAQDAESLPASVQDSSSISVSSRHLCSGKFYGFFGQNFVFLRIFWMRYQSRLHNFYECRFVVWLEEEALET